MPRAYADGLLHRRRFGRFLERHAAQRHPPRDEVGHARGRDDLGGAAAPVRSMPRRFRRTNGASRIRGRIGEMRSARNFHQGFDRGMFAGLLNAGLRRSPGGRGFGFIDRLKGEPGYERMNKAGWEPKETPRAVDRQRADLRQADRRVQQRHDARRESTVPFASFPIRTSVATAARPSTAIRANTSVRPRCTSRCSKRTTAVFERASADQLHQLRALQNLRHRRSVSDHHVGPAAGRRGSRVHRDVAAAHCERRAVTSSIVGAGVIGLSIAFELGATRRERARLRSRRTGARGVLGGAGMLAPYTERIADEALLHLCADSLAEYPAFVERVRERERHRFGIASRRHLLCSV